MRHVFRIAIDGLMMTAAILILLPAMGFAKLTGLWREGDDR